MVALRQARVYLCVLLLPLKQPGYKQLLQSLNQKMAVGAQAWALCQNTGFKSSIFPASTFEWSTGLEREVISTSITLEVADYVQENV